jgi:dipeptidyl aminopeptidase/acylaminoacyl peptidase
VRGLTTFGSGAVALLGSPTEEPNVVMVDVTEPATPDFVSLRPARDLGLGPEWISTPEAIDFPTAGGGTAHALLYRPTHPTATPPTGERPPLIVAIHGGPTSAARAYLNPGLQYWTSRGFAVVDVDYRGSTGYGREYQRLLDGQWGVADVEDCLAVAAHLADRGEVDRDRLAIRGGSAGGTTALLALESGDLFGGAASSYGVTDMEALARDTHKFESRYLDTLIGPYPEARERYVERSPIHHLDRLSTPLIVFQGADDAIVPPSQAEELVAALGERAVPHAYLLFEGEQHGFRRAETIRRVLGAELYFYSRIFGFEPADHIEPVTIEHLPA